MRIPGIRERYLWWYLWGRNPLTLGLIGLLPHGRVDRPIFILGSPRSGTSVFSRYFGQHPELANWSEGHCLFDPMYMNRRAEHRWTEEQASWYGSRRLHSNIYWFMRYMRWRQRLPIKRFTNKLPRNTLRVPWLLKVFPDAHFVHIIRDGRAVIRSMVRVIEKNNLYDRPLGQFARPPGWQEYYQNDIYEAHSRQWVGIEETVQKDLEAVPTERVYRTKYEEFILNTRGIMKEICEQFGLDASDAALARYPEHLENRNAKWPRECSPEQIETMRKWASPMLIHYGYEKDEHWSAPGESAPDDRRESRTSLADAPAAARNS